MPSQFPSNNVSGDLTVTGSGTFGSGAVEIINSAGKIPALSSTYLASLDGSNLTGIGGTPEILTKTANYTCTTGDCGDDAVIFCDSSSGAFTVTAYAASGNAGKKITVLKTAGSAAVSFDGNSSETIGGIVTPICYETGDYITAICDGSNWQIVGENVTMIYEATLSSAQSIPTSTWTKVTLDSASKGSVFHATNAFTPPRPGLYLAQGHAYLDGVNGATGGVGVWVNGGWTTGTTNQINTVQHWYGTAGTLMPLTASQRIELWVYQSRGININCQSALQNTSLRVTYLGRKGQ